MWRVWMTLMALLLATPGAALATHCRWVADPGSAADVISLVNREASEDSVEFDIFDNSGNQLGNPFLTPMISPGGRFETTVGEIYAATGVSTTQIKQTYILAIESANFETVLQVKTGGGTFQPVHFDVDFGGAANCAQQ